MSESLSLTQECECWSISSKDISHIASPLGSPALAGEVPVCFQGRDVPQRMASHIVEGLHVSVKIFLFNVPRFLSVFIYRSSNFILVPCWNKKPGRINVINYVAEYILKYFVCQRAQLHKYSQLISYLLVSLFASL